MSAPTEAEIREAIIEHGTYPQDGGLKGRLAVFVREWANSIKCGAFDALDPDFDQATEEPYYSGSWWDLRASEAIVLRDLALAAEGRAVERSVAIILEELTAAGVAFAEAYPDAPWIPLEETVAA
jgi:hypothetical protein